MGILLAFAPFIFFVVVERLVGPTAGLITGAIVSLVLVIRDSLVRHQALKVLEVGSMLLFALLAVYCVAMKITWTVAAVRLRVDAGLFVIVLLSVVIRKPFTLQYAREQTPREIWLLPRFVRTNYIITLVWAAAFAVMVAADVLMAYVTDVPKSIGIIATVVALVAAIKFTSWYPEHVRGTPEVELRD